MGNLASDIVLIQPPILLPTAVPAGIPHLIANLNAHDISSTFLDTGIDFINTALSEPILERLLAHAEKRLEFFNSKASLSALDIAEYAPLTRCAANKNLPYEVEDAIAVFRDSERFYDFESYYCAARKVEEAVRLLQAASFPVDFDLGDMRSLTQDIHVKTSALYDAVEEFDAKIEGNIIREILIDLLDKGFAPGPPKLVGISISFAPQWLFSHWMAKEIRRRYPDTFIVLGGSTASKLGRKTHDRGQWPLFRSADAIAVADGEQTIINLAKAVLAGEKVKPQNNLILYDRETKKGVMPAIELLHDLNSVPPPDYSCVDMEKYWNPRPALPLVVSKGCYWDKCTFCYFGDVTDPRRVTSPYRELSISNIVDHMILQNERHGCTTFTLVTDAASPAFLLKLSKALIAAGRTDLKWSTQARAEKNFKRERTEILAQGGCSHIFFGLESFDDKVLADIDKGTTADQYERVLTDFYEVGIATGAMGFFDFPTEDYAAARRTLDFLREHVDVLSELNWGYFMLEQGARVHKHPELYGIKRLYEQDHSEADTACAVTYETEAVMKTPEQGRQIRNELMDIASLFACEFKRPFLAGSRCEHSVFYYEKFGPGALKDFAKFVADRSERIPADVPVKFSGSTSEMRYDLPTLYEAEHSIISALDDGGTPRSGKYEQMTVTLTTKSLPFLDRYKKWDEMHPGGIAPANEPGIVLAGPGKYAQVSEDVVDLLTFFEQPATFEELAEELGEDLDKVRPYLVDALRWGWLMPVGPSGP